MAPKISIDVDMMRDFTRYPAGRYQIDGPWSGQKFREEILIPRLNQKKVFTIELDSALGYGSSFLEEAFGGLVRRGFSAQEILDTITLKTRDGALREEIESYIREAKKSA